MKNINLRDLEKLFTVTDARRIPWAKDHAVTSDGRVFTCRKSFRRSDAPVRELNQSTHLYGYKYVRICLAPKLVRCVTMHSLVAELFIGPRPKDKDRVLHWDGDPANNHVSNLRWGTQKENMQDMIRHGRSRKGLKNHNAKLNPKRSRIIQDLVGEGFSVEAVACFFDVSGSTVRSVVQNRHWTQKNAN